MLVKKEGYSDRYGIVLFVKPWQNLSQWSSQFVKAKQGQGVAVAELPYGFNREQADPEKFVRSMALAPRVWQLRQLYEVVPIKAETEDAIVTDLAQYITERDESRRESARKRAEADAAREAGKEERRKRFHAASALQSELTKGSTVSEDRWGEKASVTMPLEVYERLVMAIGTAEAEGYRDGYKDCQYDYDEKPVVIP
jgi:hypothetical protein